MGELADAEFVVIGGGAVGCAVAYSLAEAGRNDVLVLEREPALASVTSAQAAGLVGQVRSTVERTRLAMWSAATFSRLQAHAEVTPHWRQVGSLRIALTDERVAEFHRLVAIAQEAGLEVAWLNAAEAREKWPVMDFRPARAVLWCPSDGYIQPYDLAMCYQHRARQRGVRFATGTLVEGIDCRQGRVEAVRTNRGRVQCRWAINAAGAHAYHVAQLVGLELPIVPVRHEYFVTVPLAGLEPHWPALRVPDATLYGRADVNSLLLGGWEPAAMSLRPSQYELTGEPPVIREDWDVLGEFARVFAPLFPQVQEAGVRSVFKGWPTFTPDGRFILGESSLMPGFVMAGGCNAHGVSGSAGIGRHVVEALLEPNPSAYVQSLSPDRFRPGSWDWESAQRAAQHVYETYYAIS